MPLEATDPWAHVTFVPTSDFVTFLADVHDQLPTDQAALVEDTLRRERSLLYVAATRARDELVVLWTGAPSNLLPNIETGAAH